MQRIHLALVLVLGLAACLTDGDKSKPQTEGAQTGAPASGGATAGAVSAPPDVAAPPADAERTASGLVSKVLQPGSGDEKPTADDIVEVNYTGWTAAGRMFDATPRPTRFGLKQVISGWTEGLQLMRTGEKRRFWIPAKLAYGDVSNDPRGPAGPLVFDIELVGITRAPVTPEVPPDVAAPPADAKKTPSGLASKVLKEGTGTRHPKPTDKVEVHYSGWTANGKLFDSSLLRGTPARFQLSQVIRGWTEGVPLMVEGEKRRFWIPAKLAYGDKPKGGAPAGMLVFEIELRKIL